MKIGLLIDHHGLSYEEIKSMASLADILGYHSISLTDDSTSKDSIDTWSLLPGLALNTRQARLLPLVTDNTVRHPGILAKMAATIDIISKGRLDFGIGAGLASSKVQDRTTRIGMLDESVQVLLKLWTESPLSSFKGNYYSLEDAESLPKPIQKPHPPILIGGMNGDVLDIVAKYGEMSNFIVRSNPKLCQDLLAKLRASCEKEMRSYQSIVKTVLGSCSMSDTTPNGHALHGTKDEIASQLQKYQDMGVHLFIVKFARGNQVEEAKRFASAFVEKAS